MRSRDGNHSFIFSVCTLIFCSIFSSAYAEEYLISYRYVIKDAFLYNEKLDISRAMQKCEGEPSHSLLLDTTDSKHLKSIILDNFEEFSDYIQKLGLHVEHATTSSGYTHQQSSTIVTLKTTCFKVDFNDTSVRISALK